MDIAKVMIQAMQDEGLPVDNYANMDNYLNHAIHDDRFKFLEKNGQSIGFVVWELLWLDEGLDLYVSYLVILKKYKGMLNLKELTSFWKNKYNGVHKLRWHDHRTDTVKEFLQPQELVHG